MFIQVPVFVAIVLYTQVHPNFGCLEVDLETGTRIKTEYLWESFDIPSLKAVKSCMLTHR